MAETAGKQADGRNTSDSSGTVLSDEEWIELKAMQVRQLSKQVSDIQTKIDVEFGDKSPFHLKVKELQREISTKFRRSHQSSHLKRKVDEVQKSLKTCANFRPRTGGFFIRLFLGQVLRFHLVILPPTSFDGCQ
jgi:predicted RNase H-like nuclease (RuvC/YqgF family)